MSRRVVITGLGTVNPVGKSVPETWENLVNGVSGVGRITLFDASGFSIQIACEVKNFDPAQYMDPREARRRDRYEQLGCAAAKEAVEHSGLEITEENAGRVAVVVSSAIGGISSIESSVHTLNEQGARRLGPFLIPMLMPNGASGMISIDIGAKGPNFSVASACASGADGIGAAWNLIRYGEADAAVAGGTDHTICPVAVAAFDRLGAMSRRNDDYSMTPAPFDKNRDGLVMGEGAGVVVLEELEHAKARGAEILAELAGHAASADAFHVTAPAEGGVGGALAMRRALELARLNPEDVDYISAHGTATPLNDAAETQAIKAALGDHAYQVPVSSTKSMTGHMMGATAALEAIVCVKAIQTGCLPPTIHYQTPDPECDLDYVPNMARAHRVRVAMSNAFGFGGHNAVLVIKEYVP